MFSISLRTFRFLLFRFHLYSDDCEPGDHQSDKGANQTEWAPEDAHQRERSPEDNQSQEKAHPDKHLGAIRVRYATHRKPQAVEMNGADKQSCQNAE
jgi:hypothetical protein